MRRLGLTLAFALAGPSAAETPVAPKAFEALSAGRTLHFTLDGAPFGAEQFLNDRRTIWRFADERCEAGRWWPEGEAICFSYENLPDALCWRFVSTGGGYAAELLEGGAAPGFRLDLDRLADDPLPCPGPRVGS